MTSQIAPYWDSVLNQCQGPSNTPSGSVEIFASSQATAASATVPLGIATRAGFLVDTRVAAITPLTGNATYTVDIRKNGTTVLSAAIGLLTTTAARASVVGALAVANTPVAAGDFFEAVITNTPGTGAAPANIVFQMQLIQN